MNSAHHDLIRSLADMLYRATDAYPIYFTASDVRRVAKLTDITTPLSHSDCTAIVDNMVDAADFDPLLETAISVHFDMKAEATDATASLVREMKLKLAELEGALSISEGAKS